MPFNPRKDVPSLTGKVILVTGGNSGLGKQSVIEFAKHEPSQIWLTARDMVKAKAAVDDVEKQVPGVPPINVLQLDLSSLESVKDAAKKFTALSDRLDILMLNAGTLGTPPGLTKDGFETQFGTNHVGHFLLTKLLMHILVKTADSDPNSDVRVVCLSSDMHRVTPPLGIQFDTLKTNGATLTAFQRYGQSKLANVLFAKELAKRYPQLKVIAVHPGVVNTKLVAIIAESSLLVRGARKVASPFLATVEKGVKNQIWAAVAKDVVSGEYYEPVGVMGKGNKRTHDVALAKKLWDWTEEELQGYIV